MKYFKLFENFVNEGNQSTAKKLVAKLIKGNPKFNWLKKDLPKDYTLEDVEEILNKYGYGQEYERNLDESEEFNEPINEDMVYNLYALLASANAMMAIGFALNNASGDPITPIQDLKNWWAKRKKDKAVQSIVNKLKDDPDVAAFMNQSTAAQRGKWYKLIEPKLNDEEKKYLRSISKTSFTNEEVNEGNAASWSKAQLDKELKGLAQGSRDAGDIDDSMAFDIADGWLSDNPGAEVAIKKHYRASDAQGFIANRIV